MRPLKLSRKVFTLAGSIYHERYAFSFASSIKFSPYPCANLYRAVQNRSLRLRCGGGCPLKNCGCLFDISDTEKDQRSIRSGLQAAICVVDTDIGLSQSGGYARNLAGPVRN